MTARVEVRRNDHGGWACLVDGVDMAHKIVAGGLSIALPSDSNGGALVTMTLRAELDLDLPASEIGWRR